MNIEEILEKLRLIQDLIDELECMDSTQKYEVEDELYKLISDLEDSDSIDVSSEIYSDV
jgi:hypothetical protein|tara:strand:- start:52 stop:228 length:177 start_codon:yes stop_codon:yes gene_type:complete